MLYRIDNHEEYLILFLRPISGGTRAVNAALGPSCMREMWWEGKKGRTMCPYYLVVDQGLAVQITEDDDGQ